MKPLQIGFVKAMAPSFSGLRVIAAAAAGFADTAVPVPVGAAIGFGAAEVGAPLGETALLVDFDDKTVGLPQRKVGQSSSSVHHWAASDL